MRRLLLPLVLLAGCHRSGGVRDVTIEDRDAHWQKAGFVELVPSVRPPTTTDEKDLVKVWLKLPDQGKVAMSAGSLRVPPGTVADRVESLGRGGIDVRGTSFGERGAEKFHVYHSDEKKPGAPLAGWEWPRGDEKAQAEATERLVASLTAAHALPGEIEMLRGFNDCSRCHEHQKPELNRAEVRAPRRSTDGSGLFELLAVLRDESPIEMNRPRDMNVGLPFVEVRCGAARAELQVRPDGARRFVCKDGSVPIGKLDVARAMAANDPYAQEVCKARRYLYDHMDDGARKEFQAGFAACGIGDAPAPPTGGGGPT